MRAEQRGSGVNTRLNSVQVWTWRHYVRVGRSTGPKTHTGSYTRVAIRFGVIRTTEGDHLLIKTYLDDEDMVVAPSTRVVAV